MRVSVGLWMVAITVFIVACTSGSTQSALSPQTAEAEAEVNTVEGAVPEPTTPIPAAAQQPTPNPTSTDATDAPSPSPTTSSASPIEELLGAEASPEELSQLHGQAEIDAAEIATACVKRAGYNYVVMAREPPPPESFIPSGKSTTDLIEEYGYVTWPLVHAIETLGATHELVPIESRVTREMVEDGVFFDVRTKCQAEARLEVPFFGNSGQTNTSPR